MDSLSVVGFTEQIIGLGECVTTTTTFVDY